MRRKAGLVLGVGMLVAGHVWAQTPAVTIPKDVESILKDLHSTQFAEREKATLALMQMPGDARGMIESAYAQAKDAETISRLERVLVHLYMKERTSFEGKVGLMGVRLQTEMVQLDPKNQNYQACVLIVKAQPGFQAAEVLQPADRIIGMNGTLFPINLSTEQFRNSINAAGGGTMIPFTVVRDGKVIEVRVRLAGIRPEDAPYLDQMVTARDQEIAEYTEKLRAMHPVETLMVREEDGGAGIERLIGPAR